MKLRKMSSRETRLTEYSSNTYFFLACSRVPKNCGKGRPLSIIGPGRGEEGAEGEGQGPQSTSQAACTIEASSL